MFARFAHLACAVVVVASSARSQTVQWVFQPETSHWYGVPLQPTTWTEGETLAQSKGGHLATIRSAVENAFFASALSSVSATGFWIGLNDATTEGQYVWSAGVANPYTNWAPGEPNNLGNQDYVRLTPATSWRWEDLAGTEPNSLPLVEVASAPGSSWYLPKTLGIGNGPAFLASGDFNGDGRPDYAVPNRASGTVSIVLGQAGGTWASPFDLTAPGEPVTAVVADLDGDMDADVAVACSVTHRIRIFFGNGAGAFPTTQDLDHAGNASGLVALDADGDGRMDLAETTLADRLLVWRNPPSVGFTTPDVYATGSFPAAVSAGDLNGDGRADLVVSNYFSNDLSIFLNQPTGGFSTTALLARGNFPGRVALGDFDGDGDTDMAVPLNWGALHLFTGNGDGTFAASFGALPLAGSAVYALATDVEGDGRTDLFVSLASANQIAVLRGVPNGPFASPEMLRAASSPAGLLVLDDDGDGFRDVVFAAGGEAKLGVLRRIARDCNVNGVEDAADIALGTSLDCNANGVPDTCDLLAPASFDCDANGAIDSCEIAANAGLDLDGDAVLDRCESAGNAFCFGDGSGAACPCDPGQAADTGRGCQHSQGVGARLLGTGNTQVSGDSLTLHATDVPFTTMGLFFQGTQAQAAGAGAAFGDGLLCVNQNILRLRVRAAVGNTIVLGREVVGDNPLSQTGLVPVGGGTRYYQVWYRDSAPFCSAAAYNLTNGFRVTWTP